jgi:transposase InsO family protein
MPWKEVSTMSLRLEFVTLAQEPAVNFRDLCRRFGVSPKTGYKWLRRFRHGGEAALADRSRRPRHAPGRTAAATEQAVLELRGQHPAWGGRKLRARLRALGQADVPAASTITAILRRHDRLAGGRAGQPRAFVRFEHAAPNDLWQMDFKGHFALGDGRRCHPLTVLDDHSRFALGLRACADEQGATVQRELTGLSRRYGLPVRMLMDNGSPWGDDPDSPYTPLTVWLLRLGVRLSHGRPYHPQTQGKDERFHRTLKAEVLARGPFADPGVAQRHFDAWRGVYNLQRPHESLGLQVPASRYRPSPRPFPEVLPPITYPPGDEVRRVQEGGWFSYRGRAYRVAKAFRGQPVGLRRQGPPEQWQVWFCQTCLGTIDLTEPGRVRRPRE